MQELFQCKLTRKGTIAPSDRQSKLRKSMVNTFAEFDNKSSQDTTATTTMTQISASQVIGQPESLSSFDNKTKFTVTVSNSTISSNQSNGVGHLTIKNKDDLRNSINLHVTNQYASDKVLPLTVACHFKVSTIIYFNKIISVLLNFYLFFL